MKTIIEKHYRHNFNSLVKRLKFRAGSVEAAEDIIQDAYERALLYIGSFNVGENFNHWFMRVVSNALKDYKNNEKGRGYEELNHDILLGEINPMFESYYKEEVKELISLKKEAHQEILSLYFTFGYGLKQITHITDIPYKTVSQAIQRFKTELKNEDFRRGSRK